MCPSSSSSAELVQVSTPDDFFPKSAIRTATERSGSSHTGLQQNISTKLTAVKQSKDGFLVEIPFALSEVKEAKEQTGEKTTLAF